ncbi:Ig-like domain-containing protein [Geomonas sp. RF6]|uniref:Ig-like domain-containing protein n=1 Tax=Geomonas sp. RF6 TaxID=2897342 RepID=UPI001E2F0D55|nr:Ig-like domain-containing protein [Geomonas sp. RF6]UFS68944.1 Ig-like domain-containing protein [Geomonas sp. RF6]
MRKPLLLLWAMVMSLLALSGCGGGGSGGGNGSSANVATGPTIQVHPATLTLPPGTTQQYTATLVATDGSTQDVTGTVTWSSSASAVASVSSSGLVTAGSTPGTAVITAAGSGATGSATVKVLALSSIAIDPVPSMPVGVPKQLTAKGTFSDNSTGDITSLVSWSSSDTAKATVSSTGLVTSVAPGAVTITATLAGISGSVGITINAATINSLSIDQGNSTIAIGTSMRFTAKAGYSDGSTHDVTPAATWTSSDPTVATMAADASGRVSATGLKQGSTTITAAYGGRQAQATLTVSGAHAVSITVEPGTPAVGLGIEKVQLTAVANFSDGTKQDVTETVTWFSSDEQVAVVDNTSNKGETSTAIRTGKSTLTARWPLDQSVSAQSVMTVNPPQPTIGSIGPTSGPIGQLVRIMGTNFVPGTTVSIGGVTGIETMVAHSSYLSFAVPAGITSPSTVKVTTPYGEATSTEAFTVQQPTAAPTVTSFAPAIGPVGQTVTVHGQDFISGRTSVTIGAVPGTNVQVLDSYTLIFTVPSIAEGSGGAITVSTTDFGAGAPSTAVFTVQTPTGAPTITAVDHYIGPPGAYRIVTGTNFVPGRTYISMGGVTRIETTVYGTNQLSFLVPKGTLTNTKITVETPSGSAESPEIFVVTKK